MMDTNDKQLPIGKTDDMAALSSALAELDIDFVMKQKAIYEKLITTVPTALGKQKSKEERELKKLSQSTLVYGEINFESFGTALEKIKRRYDGLREKGGKFYDLGSGTGKPCFAAALLHDFEKVTGIEILTGLHKVSLDLLDRYKKDFKETMTEAKDRMKVEFICGDMTKLDWSDATLIFANSTCYDNILMSEIAECAKACKVGTFCITYTKKLPSELWQVLEFQRYQQSWGEATVYIQKKIS